MSSDRLLKLCCFFQFEVSKSSTENTSSDSVAWILISDGKYVNFTMHNIKYILFDDYTTFIQIT